MIEKPTSWRVRQRAAADALPPYIGLRLRAVLNRRELFGLHAPASLLTDLVPSGRLAVDAGANRGLYAYWISRRATLVHAFEPNPQVFSYLNRAAGHSIRAHNIALSDKDGSARLLIPKGHGDGEASIARSLDDDNSVIATVRTRHLDSYDLEPVGFLKIDVEGHEHEVLLGARGTILSSRPTVFIEIEDRHHAGAVQSVSDTLLSTFKYKYAYFLLRGALHQIRRIRPLCPPVVGRTECVISELCEQLRVLRSENSLT